MSEHSIELLGQKFSYPTTWQGASSILVVCASLTVFAMNLSPEQAEIIRLAFGSESDKQFESGLVEINEKISNENAFLKAQVLELTEAANIPEAQRREIVSKVEEAEKEISDAYANIIDMQVERQKTLRAAIPISTQQQQQVLTIEQARIVQQIGQLQQQQQTQLQRSPNF